MKRRFTYKLNLNLISEQVFLFFFNILIQYCARYFIFVNSFSRARLLLCCKLRALTGDIIDIQELNNFNLYLFEKQRVSLIFFQNQGSYE